MANFLKLTSQIENRLGQYATRMFRIEAHLRQGDTRAAEHRLDGFLEELDEFEDDLEFPIEMVAVGSQLGFLSGKGSVLRGRLPAALVGGVAGWLFGQSTAHTYREAIQELKVRVRAIELQMEQADQATVDEQAAEQQAADEASQAAEEASTAAVSEQPSEVEG